MCLIIYKQNSHISTKICLTNLRKDIHLEAGSKGILSFYLFAVEKLINLNEERKSQCQNLLIYSFKSSFS